MTKKNLSNAAWKLRATGALLLALALSTFPAAFSRAVKAQTPAKATAQTPAKATTSPATESKGGQKEGIKVHGHWTIDVRNPDGTLVTHREFENDLDLTGRGTLVSLLGRQKTNGGWLVELAGFSGTSPCEDSNSAIVACEIYESTAPWISPNYFKTLTLSLLSLNTGNDRLMLSGSATAARVGTIDLVNTAIYTCPWGVTTQVCTYPGGTSPYTNESSLTSKRLAQPVNGVCPDPACAVNVVAGQIIQVTVVISFS